VTLRTVSSEIPAPQRHLVVHEDLLERRFVGPVDQLTVDGVLALFRGRTNIGTGTHD
jgi:hypothetical protein